MPRHTWTVRIELCETYDAVYAHAFLENGPAPVSGHGKALVGDITTAVQSRATAARRALADLSNAMLAAQQEQAAAAAPAPVETPPAPAHVLDLQPAVPGHASPDERLATGDHALSLVAEH